MKHRKLLYSDPRINTRPIGILPYLFVLSSLIIICTAYALMCRAMAVQEIEIIYIVLATLTFILLISAWLVGVIVYLRKFLVEKPLLPLSNAARKVASGDFSVKLSPMRKDGKKDIFEVLYDDFNMMVSELASVEMMKTDFVSNVSHELKTPLSVIQNYATMLQSDSLSNEERKEYAEKISNAAQRLTVFVKDVLQLSRLENQKIVSNKKRYNLSEQLCRCILGYEQVWEEKHITLDTDLDESINVVADEDLVDIVWNNLLSNALKFTPEKGLVTISAKAENGYAVVSVADNGCGMTEHDIKHIFDKFYQADTSHATKGNGLGLALVWNIIPLIKGEMTVESTPNEGSRFTVKFPLE